VPLLAHSGVHGQSSFLRSIAETTGRDPSWRAGHGWMLSAWVAAFAPPGSPVTNGGAPAPDRGMTEK
jgi:hypothetical protein